MSWVARRLGLFDILSVAHLNSPVKQKPLDDFKTTEYDLTSIWGLFDDPPLMTLPRKQS